MKYFKMEGHSRHLKQAFWYLPNISKVAFYKTASGGHLDLPMWAKIFLSDVRHCVKFENNHRKQSGQSVHKLNRHMVDILFLSWRPPLFINFSINRSTNISHKVWGNITPRWPVSRNRDCINLVINYSFSIFYSFQEN